MGFFTSYILLLFLVIKGLQSMASLVEYKIIKQNKTIVIWNKYIY